MSPSDLEQLAGPIRFARAYTLRLLEQTPLADWFRMPSSGVTHVAWQVGHLAMAQYRMALERIRGARPEDAELISVDFLRVFGRDSVPDPDPAHYPAQEEIRAVFDRVHEQVLRELPGFLALDLDQPPVKAHSLCATRRACLAWCAQHEMVHAGQIGLLRRLLGHPPLW
jgi:hypothetical protein